MRLTAHASDIYNNDDVTIVSLFRLHIFLRAKSAARGGPDLGGFSVGGNPLDLVLEAILAHKADALDLSQEQHGSWLGQFESLMLRPTAVQALIGTHHLAYLKKYTLRAVNSFWLCVCRRRQGAGADARACPR